MAQETRIYFTDDLTGKEIPEDQARTVRFTYDGVEYELDLSADSATKLDEALQPFVGSARRVSGRSSSKPRSNNPAGTSLAEIREWAKANGHIFSDRGRISADVLSAYRRANK